MSKQCVTCGKVFSSYRYLKCHYNYKGGEVCWKAWLKQEAPPIPEPSPCKRHKSSAMLPDKVLQEVLDEVVKNAYVDSDKNFTQLDPDKSHVNTQEFFGYQDLLDNDEYSSVDDEVLGDDSDDDEEDRSEAPINTDLLSCFEEYQADCRKNRYYLTPDLGAAVSLLTMLSEKRIPLNVYDDIVKWHTEHIEATTVASRSTLMKKLSKRYNMDKCQPLVKKVELPHSKARIDLVCHDMGYQIMSLLTDPRILDNDYLFFEDDPFAPPPPEFQIVGDINTGNCYRKTYEGLIKNPGKEVLLPIIFYMDSACTGSDMNLPIESLQFTLGIFNSNTRDKAYAWRNIGYVKNYLVEETQAVDNILASDHMDAGNYLENLESDTESSDKEDSITGNEEEYYDHDKSQDLHAMLDVMLKSYLNIQNSGGIEWKLRYKGKTHHVLFKPFVMFIKGDSVEHDKHCGHFQAKTKNVKMLCRYCLCKAEDMDDAYQNATIRNPGMIQKLVDKGDVEALRQISQQCIFNAWYPVKFGLHNQLSVHGACAMEILHWFLLGKYKYSREMFVKMTGDKTILAKLFNGIAKTISIFLKRQSDRSLPRVVFSRGIQNGKLTGQEMTGLILVLLATIVSASGTNCLLTQCRGDQKKYFGKIELIQDWVLLLETQLQWEAWLSSPELSVYDVRRSKTKVWELMEMEKKIGRREKGMGFRTMNFHACLHVAEDILNFGVPNNVNTRSNEQHHKKSKTAAKRTQKRAKIFDLQCANQIHDMNLIELAQEEINGNRVWDYYYQTECVDDDATEQVSQENEVSQKLTGVQTTFCYDPETSEYKFRVRTRMEHKHLFKYSEDLVPYLGYVMELVGCGVTEMYLYTEHLRNGQIFRASPSHLGAPWRDWVMITWTNEQGRPEDSPAQIHCFLDLRKLPPNSPVHPAIYAVVESASPDTSEPQPNQVVSDLFIPYIKETETDDDTGITQRKFYFVDVETIAASACVIPNLGHENPAALLCMVPRSDWAKQFREWLSAEHRRDFKAE